MELDSYMYQTVGSNVTLAIAEVLGKVLIRRKIVGKPKIMSLGYEGSGEDKEGD